MPGDYPPRGGRDQKPPRQVLLDLVEVVNSGVQPNIKYGVFKEAYPSTDALIGRLVNNTLTADDQELLNEIRKALGSNEVYELVVEYLKKLKGAAEPITIRADVNEFDSGNTGSVIVHPDLLEHTTTHQAAQSRPSANGEGTQTKTRAVKKELQDEYGWIVALEKQGITSRRDLAQKRAARWEAGGPLEHKKASIKTTGQVSMVDTIISDYLKYPIFLDGEKVKVPVEELFALAPVPSEDESEKLSGDQKDFISFLEVVKRQRKDSSDNPVPYEEQVLHEVDEIQDDWQVADPRPDIQGTEVFIRVRRRVPTTSRPGSAVLQNIVFEVPEKALAAMNPEMPDFS